MQKMEYSNTSTLSFEGIEDKDFGDVVPKGKYLVQIVGANVYTPEDASKSQGLRLRFNVLDQSADVKGDQTDSVISEYCSLKETALWKIKALFNAAFGRQVLQGVPEDLEGKRLVVHVTVEEWNGNDQNRINRFRPATDWSKVSGKGDGGGAAPVASDDEEVSI